MSASNCTRYQTTTSGCKCSEINRLPNDRMLGPQGKEVGISRMTITLFAELQIRDVNLVLVCTINAQQRVDDIIGYTDET